jgi:hypothetical protein
VGFDVRHNRHETVRRPFNYAIHREAWIVPAVLIVLAGCAFEKTPTAPSTFATTAPLPRIVPSFAGQWEGQLELVSCRAAVFRACVEHPADATYTLFLSLREEDAELRGHYRITNTPPPGYFITVAMDKEGEFRGRVVDAHVLVGEGQDTHFVIPETTSKISNWRSEFGTNDLVIGEFEWIRSYPPSSERETLQLHFKFSGLSRVPNQ